MKYQSLFSEKKKKSIINLSCTESVQKVVKFNPSPAESEYNLPLQTVYIQISWLLKPTDLDLYCLPLSTSIYVKNLDQVI